MSNSFDWKDYLTIATGLAAQKTEGAMRSAISRSYYFAFNVTRQCARRENPLVVTTDHTIFWRQVSELWADQSLQTYGDRIRRDRNRADYYDTFPKLEEQLKATIVTSIRIVNEVTKLSASKASPKKSK